MRYKRRDVAQLVGEEGKGGKWMSGVVRTDAGILLFVTLDKRNYDVEHRYEDHLPDASTVVWQSQARAAPDNAWGRAHLTGDHVQHMFVRETPRHEFAYLGPVTPTHWQGAKPMTVRWRLISPVPGDLLESLQGATNHAGGRVEGTYGDAHETSIRPGLRAVPAGEHAWGWAGSAMDFINSSDQEIEEALADHHTRRISAEDLDSGQIAAWRRTVRVLRKTFEPLDHGVLHSTLVVLEYELPGEGGRRPDVVIVLQSGRILVIECKNRAEARMADLDQVLGYARDLSEYHSESHDREVTPILALLRPNPAPAVGHRTQVLTVSGGSLVELASQIASDPGGEYDPVQWLEGEYAPLPHLVEAVIQTFNERSLPRIKTVGSSNAPRAVQTVMDAASYARDNDAHVLVLVTGAPGSGKTLVGVETTIRAYQAEMPSMYISGNGPLVSVLEDALDRAGAEGAAKSLVRHMYRLKSDLTRNDTTAPANIYVFDEGQRAWTSVKNYEGSEIQLLIDAASRSDWGVVVGLIGEGQEIYKQEHGSPSIWLDNLKGANTRGKTWEAWTPAGVEGADRQISELHLDRNLRAKSATRLHEWVEAVLVSNSGLAASIASELQGAGYPIHVVADRLSAEDYVIHLYQEAEDPRYGWLVSSQNKRGRDPDGIECRYVPPNMKKRVWGAWFNAPADHPESCCQLQRACDEFACQGLELDFALVYWGKDLLVDAGNLTLGGKGRSWSDDPLKHTLNVYRVLLTRGREGMVIVATDPSVRQFLESCGCTRLSGTDE